MLAKPRTLAVRLDSTQRRTSERRGELDEHRARYPLQPEMRTQRQNIGSRRASLTALPHALTAGIGITPMKPPTSRTAPCPCGSGQKYKNCHGALATAEASPNESQLAIADQFLDAGDHEAAESLCQHVLTATSTHPKALYLLSRCKHDSGNTSESLRLALRAVSALGGHPIPPPLEYQLWSHLNAMFTQALTGLDSAFGIRMQRDYEAWLSAAAESPGAPTGGDASDNPLVSVVIAAPERADVSGSLASTLRQTWTNLEVIVAYEGNDPRTNPDFPVELFAFPHRIRWLPVPGAQHPQLANAGVRAARGHFVNVLEAGHEFTPTRIEIMVRALSARGMDWGFSNAEFMDAQGNALASEQDSRVRAWRDRLDSLQETRTVGYALIQQTFIPVATGNLFFNRSLHAELGGFPASPLWAWDFCLKALWLAEPAYEPSPQYRHRITSPSPLANPITDAEGQAQIAMFREYYARACRYDEIPANPFAPCTAVWKLNFLKAIFSAAHVLALPVDVLNRIGDTILQRLQDRKRSIVEPGIDFVGFALGEFGLAENLRSLARACITETLPCSVKDTDLTLRTRQADRSLADYIVDDLQHKCVLYCLNPDMQKAVQHLILEASADGRINVGYWFWELEKLPREWEPSIAYVDEIWAPTHFVAAAIRRSTSKPLTLIPTPIQADPSRGYTRAEFGLPSNRFVFLFSFDFNSFIARKNPEAVIGAFRLAFPPTRSDVLLIIKSVKGANQPEKLRALKELIGNDERIVIRDEFFTRDQILGLQSVIDCYVSLHRSEGLGLGLAECMYQGKPVIGTGYSGNLDFMNENNSALVKYSLVPVREGEYLYHDPDFFWADPDVEHAACLMRKMVDDASWRERLAAQGQHDIRTGFSLTATAERIRERLRAIGALDPPSHPLQGCVSKDASKDVANTFEGDIAERISDATRDFDLLRTLDTAYVKHHKRPAFCHLLSKSLPRSGHHHLVAVLSKLYRPSFDYCEFYQPDTAECCKQLLCMKMCSATRINDLARHVSMQKSHDFSLDDPTPEPRPWLKYIVTVRPFRESILSEIKLFLINEYSEYIYSHGISYKELLRFHEKSIYRKALELIDVAGVAPGVQKAASFLRDRFRYHRAFRQKWKAFAEQYPGSVAWIDYDDLTGLRRTETLNDLVSMIGIEPGIPVVDAAREEQVMTDQDREAERCQLADKIMLDNRAYLDLCSEFMARFGIESPPRRAAG